mgnify:CR=1 FL=1
MSLAFKWGRELVLVLSSLINTSKTHEGKCMAYYKCIRPLTSSFLTFEEEKLYSFHSLKTLFYLKRFSFVYIKKTQFSKSVKWDIFGDFYPLCYSNRRNSVGLKLFINVLWQISPIKEESSSNALVVYPILLPRSNQGWQESLCMHTSLAFAMPLLPRYTLGWWINPKITSILRFLIFMIFRTFFHLEKYFQNFEAVFDK